MSRGSAGNVIAALANLFVPGLGHLVQGRVFAALVLFVLISVGYWFAWLIVPAVFAALLHLYAIYSAAVYRPDPEDL